MHCWTTWVHGIHPQRLSFFEDKLYRLIEELGREGIEGHDKDKSEGEKVFEKKGGNFKNAPDELDDEIEEPLSGNDFSSHRSPPQLDRAAGRRGASKWWRANRFLNDLEDYWIERKGARNQAFWGKMEKWEFQRKMIQKNSSHFHFKPLSWDEAV